MTRPKVHLICPICNTPRLVDKYYAKYHPNAVCKSCLPKILTSNSHKISKSISKKWRDPTYRHKAVQAIIKRTDEVKKKIAHSNKIAWSDPHRIDKHSQTMKQKWATDSVYAQKVRSSLIERNKSEEMAIVRPNMPRVSSLQKLLYSMLDDLNINYHPEPEDSNIKEHPCKIGPYWFDCLIDHNDVKILIEVNGDYWHKNRASLDASKLSYINNNFPQYTVKTIWEHEFKAKNRIMDLLSYWVGIDVDKVQFFLDDVKIDKISHKEASHLLSKYHYLSNAPRGGIIYGAFLGDIIIGVCTFSPLVRQNIHISFNIDAHQIRELSRFCIHPQYQKRNFASWFISRSIALLPDVFKIIIAYSDETYNHVGTIYKAANFKLDKIIKPDYWYVDNRGWVMHKKTLYNHARKMSMTEKEFANGHAYRKIWGGQKLRYVRQRK